MTKPQDEVGLAPVATLVVWTACMGVGLVKIPQSQRPMPLASPRIVQAELLHVTPGDARASDSRPTPSAAIAITPSLPAMAKFSDPTPFLSPAALPPPPSVAAPSAAPLVQQLVFGQGEGNQPTPQYPIEAQLDGEQGTVVVQFDVAADGRVESATVVTACDWPLLNRAAARSIQNTWRFAAGPQRSYVVSIVYRMKQH